MRNILLPIVGAAVLSAGALDAATLKITGTSAQSGELGYFVVDDTVLASDTSLVASQFIDYAFTDPISGVTLDPGNVDGDTGVTHFGLVSTIWTVTGGGGDSLTDSDAGSRVWIAGSSNLNFGGSNGTFSDVSWSTVEISAVPLPAAGFLLVGALGGLFGMKRRKKA